MNFHGFEARHLVILDTLFTERHVGRTALRLHLSQPAVSNTLAWLRRHFDDPLLVRSGRGLRLTPFAERLSEPVRRALLDFRTVAQDRPHFDVGTAARRFRIVLSEYGAAMIGQALVAHFAREAPSVTLELLGLDSDPHDFERGEIDLLVLPADVLHAHHPSETLFIDEWVCVSCADDRSIPNPITPDTFAAARHVLPATRQTLTVILERMRIRRDPAALVPLALLPDIVAGTPWIATVPKGLVAGSRARIATHALPWTLPPLRTGMQWRADSADEPATRWLCDTARQVAARIGGPAVITDRRS